MEGELPCVEPIYQRLVQLVARAFYAVDLKHLSKEQPDLPITSPNGRSKKQPADYTGLGAVVMDSLLNRPWWEEEEFASKLALPIRPVRQLLRLLETHSLVAREHRKDKRRKKDKERMEVPPNLEGDVVEESNQDRGNLISYCSLDYQRLYDMARFRLHKMRRKLNEELEDRRAIQEYTCLVCKKTYTSLQAPFLIKPDGLFHCEECNSILEAGADGKGDGASRRERSKGVKAKQVQLEEELKPLTAVLAEIETKLAGGESIPDFGTLAAFAESQAIRSGVAGRKTSSQAQQAAQIQINMAVPDTGVASTSDAAPRELPPWLQRQNGVEGTAASGSHSLSQEVSGDFKDIKSSSPTKLKEAEYMRQYQERMAQIASQDSKPNIKRQKVEDVWQAVDDQGGWKEVKEQATTIAPKAEPGVKQEPDIVPGMEAATGNEGGVVDDDEEWEDA